ncbi:MAG TPA: flagellar biosynthesis regulator FlaF [Candidatus Sulfotelmatobacter sp.]|nr:flagellar biosynthesis regulator FlaF [Candidatus Sulfotelmatobacter sp.]
MASPANRYQTQTTPQPGNPARTEAWALLEAARELSRTKAAGGELFLSALRRNWRLWTIFQASLLDPQCTVPVEIRSNLLGLANFIDRRTAELLATPEPDRVDALININVQIGEGLLAGARTAAPEPATPPPQANTVRETA